MPQMIQWPLQLQSRSSGRCLTAVRIERLQGGDVPVADSGIGGYAVFVPASWAVSMKVEEAMRSSLIAWMEPRQSGAAQHPTGESTSPGL